MDGRSPAWAEFEQQVAKGGHIIVEAGLLSPKDWAGLLIDIEHFRKSEQGSGKPAGDLLAEWLSAP
jgi:hypothetical protein